jgi:glycine/D-amino acid oxidase-like deaminating enzyme
MQNSNMDVDVIIIGQGICGTFLSYYLQKAEISFILIDQSKPDTASKAAAGIINPVTGRRLVETWMIDDLMTFAMSAYRQIEKELAIHCMGETKIIDFFPTPQMRSAFLSRLEENSKYLKLPTNENDWTANCVYDFGYGEIAPVLLINIHEMLTAWRRELEDKQAIIESHFEINELRVSENSIHYNDIKAEKIIFCDGAAGISNPYFKNLPFAPNKGEALIVEIKEFPTTYILKKGISIVPWEKNLFWIGSSYEWTFEHDRPTENFRKYTESILRHWIKNEFRVIEHFASIRPATLERRPFVGFHPIHKNVGILNGMGTKGCSLAPFFARQLVNYIVDNTQLQGDANVYRFEKILSRGLNPE